MTRILTRCFPNFHFSKVCDVGQSLMSCCEGNTAPPSKANVISRQETHKDNAKNLKCETEAALPSL